MEEKMSRNKKILLSILIVIIILIGYILMVQVRANHLQSKNDENELIPRAIEEASFGYDDLALSGEDTIAEGEVTIQDFPDRIIIRNKAILMDTTLPTYAYKTLEEYLTQYMDYYWDNGINYYGEVVEDSFKEDYNLPSFKIYVEDIDLEIECEYYVSREMYLFYSRFNPEHE